MVSKRCLPPPLQFADSVPTGDRSTYYYYLFLAFWFGALAGPAVAICLFLGQGNSWTFADLASVLLVGVAFKMANAVLLWFLKDEHALGAMAAHVSFSEVPEPSASTGTAAVPGKVGPEEVEEGVGKGAGGESNGCCLREQAVSSKVLQLADDGGGADRRRRAETPEEALAARRE